MRRKGNERLFFLLIAGMILGSCGGGGGGTLAGGGIGGTGVVASGAITKIGSAKVNGVTYDTNSATLDGETDGRSIRDLTEGMTVTIRGTVNSDGITGTATTVTLSDEIEGPVTAVTETVPGTTKIATVLGQTVIVQASGVVGNMGTQFSGFAVDTFAAFGVDDDGDTNPDVIEVSGFRRSDGSFVATYIEKKANSVSDFTGSGDEFEIEGIVAAPVTAGTSFSIDGLTVLWSGTVTLNDLVEVKGDTLNGNTLTATTVEVKTGDFSDGDEVEVEGFVENLTNTASVKEFEINGQLVDFSNATFENGTAAGLAENVRVEVEGPVQGTTLMAEKVRLEAEVEIESDFEAKGSNSLTLKGFSVTVLVDPVITEFDGDRASLSGIVAGDHLHIHGQETTNAGEVIATSIKAEAGSKSEVVLQGPAKSPAEPTLVVLGETLDADAFSRRKTPTNSNATTSEFFQALSVGDIVMAGGALNGNTVDWSSGELEIEE